MQEQKKILITCFEPFGIFQSNTSKKVLEMIKQAKLNNIFCKFYTFRVHQKFVNKNDLQQFERVLNEFHPNYILSMGEYIFHIQITLERIANEKHTYLFDLISYNNTFKINYGDREKVDGACLELRNFIIDWSSSHNLEGCEFIHIPKWYFTNKQANAILISLKKI